MEQPNVKDLEYSMVNVELPQMGDIATKTIHTVRFKASEMNSLKDILFVVDRSGSMSGSPLTQTKLGITEMLTQLAERAGDQIKTLITYNSRAEIYFLNGDLADNKAIINQISAGGCTSFVSAFSKIDEVLQMTRNPLVVVFFTDGQDNSSKSQDLEKWQNRLMANCKSRPIEFHSIGFSDSSDSKLLDNITRIGPISGRFQYIKEKCQIVPAIAKLFEALCGVNISISAKINGVEYQMEINKDETSASLHASKYSGEVSGDEYEATLVTPKVSPNRFTYTIKSGSQTLLVEQIQPILKTLSPRDTIMSQIQLLSSEIGNLISTLSGPTDSKLAGQKTAQYEAMVAAIMAAGRKLNAADRKTIIPACIRLTGLIKQVYACLAEIGVKGLTNDKFATLNNLAHNIHRESFKKKIDKAKAINATLLADVDAKVHEIVAAIDWQTIAENIPFIYKQLSPCLLSTNDWVDALRDSDCLCIGLNISRSEVAIADPTKVKINSIAQSYITAEQFLDSVIYTVGINADASGGFDFNAESNIIVGEAREPISGALPLYINEQNWQVARLKLKPLLGWMTTLDALGYQPQQLFTLPFIILTKAAENTYTEKNENASRQYLMILDICKAIYRDETPASLNARERSSRASGDEMGRQITVNASPQDRAAPETLARLTFVEDLRDIFVNYVSDPSVRTIDRVPSNRAFLGQIMAAISVGDLKCPDKPTFVKFFKCLIEEETRRSIKYNIARMDPTEFNNLYWDLLNVDPKYWQPQINKSIAASSQGKMGSNYGESFRAKLASMGVATTAPTTIELIESMRELDFISVDCTKSMASFIDRIALQALLSCFHGRFNPYIHIFEYDFITAHMTLHGISLEDVKLTDETCINMLLQNLLHRTNDRRTKAIKTLIARDAFVDVFQSQNPCEFLANTLISNVETKIESERAKAINLLNLDAARVFAETDDLLVAAGALDGTRFAWGFHHFIRAMEYNTQTKLAADKIRMLVSGQYKASPDITIQLVSGMPYYHTGVRLWWIGRRHGRKLWCNNANQASRAEWLDVFKYSTRLPFF